MPPLQKVGKALSKIAKKTAPGAVRKIAMKRAMVAKGRPALNPSIKTKTPKNAMGELINPTKRDVSNFNKTYTTTTLPKKQKRVTTVKTSIPVSSAVSANEAQLLNKKRQTSNGYMTR